MSVSKFVEFISVLASIFVNLVQATAIWEEALSSEKVPSKSDL